MLEVKYNRSKFSSAFHCTGFLDNWCMYTHTYMLTHTHTHAHTHIHACTYTFVLLNFKPMCLRWLGKHFVAKLYISQLPYLNFFILCVFIYKKFLRIFVLHYSTELDEELIHLPYNMNYRVSAQEI